jgi:hypothetical protein
MKRIIIAVIALTLTGCASTGYYGCDDPRKPHGCQCRGADGLLHPTHQGNRVCCLLDHKSATKGATSK